MSLTGKRAIASGGVVVFARGASDRDGLPSDRRDVFRGCTPTSASG
jgi:hypothetical protein